jgi:GTP-binding protein
LRLELRHLADVGLVGWPNAGKSTLISRISAARPKIADYPFTTLTPNLGVARVDDESFVVADIPGLIPGAHEGRGLGHQFLRHVRRAAVLVLMADLGAEDRDSLADPDILRQELRAFDPELAERPAVVVATKLDVQSGRWPDFLKRYPEALGISSVTGEGIDALLYRLKDEVLAARAATPAAVGYVRHVVREDPLSVAREDTGWRVTGSRPERLVATTNVDNEEALRRLQRRLISMGVERMLEAAGARVGDEVRIGDEVFDFQPEGSELQDAED